FKLGYSPERINPGDKERTLTKIVKVVSAQDEETLKIVADTYGAIIEAGVFKASSIKVAEAAKVIENTQRDLNIALINELAIIFDSLNISTSDVLAAASTKWNFLNFKPGLVGGHCIGVDPYYLTYKAEQLGYHTQVITAGRRINDSMGEFIARKAIKLMLSKGVSSHTAKFGIMGLTFKENVNDIRNSKVPSIIEELQEFGVKVLISDPWADVKEVKHEYDIDLTTEDNLNDLDVLLLAVPHSIYLAEHAERVLSKLKPNGILIDIKSAIDKKALAKDIDYWSL
ncbi:MAG: nucleotide sugar dehydrogenase, partial [Cytophagaceae bacterium]